MPELQTYDETFQGTLIHYEVFRGVEYSLYDNQIFYVKYPEFISVDIEIAEYGEAIINRLNLGKQFFILEFKSFADVSKEAREFAASPRAAEHSFVDAIIMNNVGLKIIANGYLKFNKPITPTKFFTSKNKAISWVFEKIKELSNE